MLIGSGVKTITYRCGNSHIAYLVLLFSHNTFDRCPSMPLKTASGQDRSEIIALLECQYLTNVALVAGWGVPTDGGDKTAAVA